ncbi:glycosyltransferase [Thermodesulfobacteriota bacterium]
MIKYSKPLKLVIIMPIYNDWESAKILVKRINAVFNNEPTEIQILLVDDGSSEPFQENFLDSDLSSISKIDLLNLRRNMGHQRAIAIALTHLYKSQPCDAVCIMDADGEDRPEDLPTLLNLFFQKGCKHVIFAERTKRMEGLTFKVLYRCYQILNRILTGHSVRVGNFSVIPYEHLSALVVSSELWNHYAATVYNLRIPFSLVPTPRDKRIFGRSKMNFISLVIHGLSAISVFGEIVGTRILFAAFGINALLIFFLLLVFISQLFTKVTIPGLVTFSAGFLLVLFVQISATTASFLFYALTNRNISSFLPLRDYSLYINIIQNVYINYEKY